MDAALFECALDLLRSNQRPRRVVHGDVSSVTLNAIQSSPNRILPTLPTANNGPDFSKSSGGTDFSDFIMRLFTRHNDDFADRNRALKRADCVSDDGFSRNDRKQFIGPHPLAAAAGYDDGTEHCDTLTPQRGVILGESEVEKSRCVAI
jgi:hypothetical protein